MSPPTSPLCALACVLALAAAARAQSALPPERVPLDSLVAFRPAADNWHLAGGLAGDPRHDKTLTPAAGTGMLICTPAKPPPDGTAHLFTTWTHGDLELDLEFLLAPGSNSGVYLQGRYEVQLYDSWGVKAPTFVDCGAIYERWDESREKGKKGFEGIAPRANACRAPGLWQHLHIEFEAPRFDAAGQKTKNARFARVVLNGFLVQENVDVTGSTRSAAFDDEAPLGPLMIQGDHGAVALREITFKRFGSERIVATDLRYKLYSGDFKTVGAYDLETPKAEGVPERFAHGAVEKSGKFALVFTGALVVPRDGAYRFATEAGGITRLLVDGRPVVIPLEKGSQPGLVTLTAGKHDFRLDLVQASTARPLLELLAEGPGIAPHAVTVRERETRPPPRPRSMPGEPKDRTVLQRGFVPFAPRKRLYAASVGTPAGVHFAYDFETGAVLRAWRGSFLNTVDMWENRGELQLARPDDPALTFNAKPAIAFIEFAASGDWPDAPEALWSSHGYTLEADGTPVFLSTLDAIAVRDRIAPTADGRGLARTVELQGKLPSWSAWLLLAEAGTITAQPGGNGWVIGEREWYLDWPADAAAPAVVRTVNGKQQLAVPLTTATLDKPIRYSIVW